MDENLENKLKNKQQQLVNFKKVTDCPFSVITL